MNLCLVLVATEDKTRKINEAKSLSKSQTKEAEKSSETRKSVELKPEKRGALQDAIQEVSKEVGEEGGDRPSHVTEVSHHRPVVIEKVVHVHVPVPHPYPVEYVKHVPYPVQVPVPVVVHKPFPVPVPKPYYVTVDEKESYPVVKHPDEVPVKVPVQIPSSARLPLSQSTIRLLSLFTKQRPDSHKIDKQQTYKTSQHGVSAHETQKVSVPKDNYGIHTRYDDVKFYNIPEINYERPSFHEPSPYQNYPEAYHEIQPAGINSFEFNIFEDHEGRLSAGLEGGGYLSHGDGFSYQRFKTC